MTVLYSKRDVKLFHFRNSSALPIFMRLPKFDGVCFNSIVLLFVRLFLLFIQSYCLADSISKTN